MGSEKTQYKLGHIPWSKGKIQGQKKCNCLHCKVEFSQYKCRQKKYCNQECFHKSRIGLSVNKGSPGPWKGKHLPNWVKTKLSNSHKGKPSSRKGIKLNFVPIKAFKKGHKTWNKNKHIDYVAGANNWNWKGGITPINQKIRQSIESKNWRRAVFERDDFTCQECGECGGKLHAHHIKPFAKFPDERFNVDNGVTLCVDCHRHIESLIKLHGDGFSNAE